MSAPQLEKNFVRTLIRRCDKILFDCIESHTSVGFPDLVMIWNNEVRLAEAKVIHPGDWIYVRNTQIAWGLKKMSRGYDIPFVVGLAGQGIGMFRYSRLTKIGGQMWKGTHRRFKVQDCELIVAGKYDDWQSFVIQNVYT